MLARDVDRRRERLIARMRLSGRCVPGHPGYALWQRVSAELVAELERAELARPVEERRAAYVAALAAQGYTHHEAEAAARGETIDWHAPRKRAADRRLVELGVVTPAQLRHLRQFVIDPPLSRRRGLDRVPRRHDGGRGATPRRPTGARRATARAPASDPASPSRPDLAARVRVLRAALDVLEILERETVVA